VNQPPANVQTYTIRPARTEDAEEICIVLVRSIREICGPDYGNDEEVLQRWTQNKKPDKIRDRLQLPERMYYVAESCDGALLGVGCLHREGKVLLCYVHPEALRGGIGSSLLQCMEAKARELSLKELTLESTITALDFYRRNGYQDDGNSVDCKGSIAYPMRKRL
jgi:N-acetylglutamate synthase-like GNAT family acetyltransferase